MSGTPNKRVHEDSGGHPSLSRYSHSKDDSGTLSGTGDTNSKLPNPSAPSDYHTGSFDTAPDSRMPKVPRTEMSNRTLLFQKYMVQSSSMNDFQSDHAVNPENRPELRGSWDSNIGDPKLESRDVKTESKEVYQGIRSDKVVRYASRGDEHMDMKLERDSYSDYRNEVKTDKDVYNPVNSHTNLKESKDHQRVWKHPDSRSNAEVARESLTPEMKDAPKEEKEGLQHEKEDVDVEMQKSTDNWKDLDKECKERRIEKDAGKGFDKDSDNGGANVDVSADKEREGFSNGVQQKKRMLRPKGSPQMANRDPRVRCRSQDNNDGSMGKGDVSTVVYRVGECMQELIKLWKEYQTSSNVSGKMPETSKTGPTLEICIPAEHVTATNRQVKGGQLWGTDIYTDDSDLVAVLMHTGYCRATASPPPPAILELRATVRVLPPQDCYVSTLRNNVRSRAWGAAIGCSFCVERCHIVKKGGGTIDLEPCLTHTSTVEPTLAPVVVERTITTRAAASNALRQQRFVREVTLQYNLCNEPWIKYSISAIADKGLKKPLFTSARLKKGEVLYLESRTRRYELCFNGEKMVKTGNDMETNGIDNDNNNNNNNMIDVFRWSECKKPLPQTVMRSIGIPLPPDHLQVLEESLDWEDIQWSQTGVWISGKEYPLSRIHFLSPV